jgi:hypothetical protein
MNDLFLDAIGQRPRLPLEFSPEIRDLAAYLPPGFVDLLSGFRVNFGKDPGFFPKRFRLDLFADLFRSGPGFFQIIVDPSKIPVAGLESLAGGLFILADDCLPFLHDGAYGFEEDSGQNEDENPDKKEDDRERDIDRKHGIFQAKR